MSISLNTGNLQGIGALDISSMDIESAMMAVQGRRANLLEGELRSQMESVNNKNNEMQQLNAQLNAARSELAALESGTAPPQVDPAMAQSNAAATTAAEATKTAAAAATIASTNFEAAANASSKANETAALSATLAQGAQAAADAANAAAESARVAAADLEKPSPVLAALEELKTDLADSHKGKSIFSSVEISPDLRARIASATGKSLGSGIGRYENIVRDLNDTISRLEKKQATEKSAAKGTLDIANAAAASTNAKAITANAAAEADAKVAAVAAEKASATHAVHVTAAAASATATAAAATAAERAKTVNAQTTANTTDNASRITHLKATIENLKTGIDSTGSSQQLDMLRLQSLSNKRNEAYEIMTNFMKKMQDNRSSIIANMR